MLLHDMPGCITPRTISQHPANIAALGPRFATRART